MIFMLLSLIDIVASFTGLYSLLYNQSINWLNTLMILVIVKGLWSVKSHYSSFIGWIDVLAPLMFFIKGPLAFTYLLLTTLLGKGLFCLMSKLK